MHMYDMVKIDKIVFEIVEGGGGAFTYLSYLDFELSFPPIDETMILLC